MPPVVDIYLIADDASIRNGIVTLLGGEGFKVREFDSALKFLQLAPSLEPGCLISDVRSADNEALPLVEKLRASGLDFPVILISRKGDVSMAVSAIRMGAADVLEWPVSQEAVISAIRRTQREPRGIRADDQLAETAKRRFALLTPRERDVLKHLSRRVAEQAHRL